MAVWARVLDCTRYRPPSPCSSAFHRPSACCGTHARQVAQLGDVLSEDMRERLWMGAMSPGEYHETHLMFVLSLHLRPHF
jgi:hypothetical protein